MDTVIIAKLDGLTRSVRNLAEPLERFSGPYAVHCAPDSRPLEALLHIATIKRMDMVNAKSYNSTMTWFRWMTVLACAWPMAAQPLPREQWGAPLVSVSHDGGKWTIAGKKQTITLNDSDLVLAIQAGPTAWKMVPSGARDMLVKSLGEEFPVALRDAGKIDIAPYDTGYKTGIKIALSQFRSNGMLHKGAELDLMVYLTVCLEGRDEDLVFDVAANEHEALVRQLDWPTALDSRDIDLTVLSNGRGALLPRNWPHEYNPIRPAGRDGKIPASDTSEVQSNVIESWSMSWWGFQKGKSAMMVIVETPDDGAYQFEHPAGGPTVIGPRWRRSLSRLAYPRAARMCFFPEGNYVTMAKRYRRYAIESGLWVSLQEKIARKPIVKELIGTPITRSGILTNLKPGSYRFDKEHPERNHRVTTFDERASQFRQLKQQGLERLSVVLTGWPHEGYDRQHPDELPPAPEAGGWEGMKRLADTCHDLGYLFSLHDQYRDYYVDAPSYDPQFAVHEEDTISPPTGFPGTRFGQWKEGYIPFMDHWDGGKQSYLNNRFMLGHLIKNYQGLFEHGIRPQGIYLDVFGYIPPDEDFNPEHPTTRSQAIRARAACYNWARANLGFIGTEAASDWTVPYADYSSPLGPVKLVPAPLFNLVYHDAIMTPYNPNDLHGLLNGGVPQASLGSAPTKEALAQIRRMSALHERVALLEMTNHEFLDKNYRRERTTFSDGTTVTADWDKNTVEIRPEL